MPPKSIQRLIRPLVRELHPYVPGEQPRIRGLIKLNTNENPYPPAPGVLAAVRSSVDARLRLYPNPTAQPLREALARLHGCRPENVLIGNGSDEVLALAVRAFVQPAEASKNPASTVQYFSPSYSLYPVLAATHGAIVNSVSLNGDFSLPTLKELKLTNWQAKAALTLVTTPNAPSARGYCTAELRALCEAHRGVVLLDEAYVDFADEHALDLALEFPHVLVARTFSKAYSLCFVRVGYCIGNEELITALDKIRDSYNVNGLGQIAALETLKHLPYYCKNFDRVRTTRGSLTDALAKLGFEVLPSQTNFILARPPGLPAEQWLEELRARKILVRWFKNADLRHYLRITIGTDDQARKLIAAVKQIVASQR